jgi:hypothetical protein
MTDSAPTDSATTAPEYPAEDYPGAGGTAEPDIGVLPDVPDDPEEAVAGAVVDDSWAEVLPDEPPEWH